MLNRMSMRTRITLSTAIILTVVCLTLMGISVENARRTFIPTIYKDQVNLSEDGDKSIGFHNSKVDNSVKKVDEINLAERQIIFKNKSIVYTIIFVAISSLIIWLVVGTSLKPLNKLTDEMGKIDENNLRTNIEVMDNDHREIALLTMAFNNMIDKINRGMESQKRFSNNISHELYTPITSILSNIEVLKINDSISIEEYEEVLNIVEDQTESMSEIIKNLRYMYSKIDRDSFEIFSGRDMFIDIISSYDNYIEDKNIVVFLEGDISLNGNRILLERAFSNIIQNAIRYNIENGSIDISLEDDLIRISDSGIGIKEENIDKVFEAFYCEDLSRSKELGGSGLGLSITKQILDNHDMDIRLESNSKGSSFEIRV